MAKYDAVRPTDPSRPVLALGVIDVVAVDDLSAPGTRLRVSARGKWMRDVVIPDGVPEILRELDAKYTMVWASEWGPNAHFALQQALGLSPVPWPYIPVQFDKQTRIELYADGLPWYWIDSPDIDLHPVSDTDPRIIRVDPTIGLRRSDIAGLLAA